MNEFYYGPTKEKPYFLNFRTKNEMSLFFRIIWIAFGKKYDAAKSLEDGNIWHVKAYELFGKTLIVKCEKLL